MYNKRNTKRRHHPLDLITLAVNNPTARYYTPVFNIPIHPYTVDTPLHHFSSQM